MKKYNLGAPKNKDARNQAIDDMRTVNIHILINSESLVRRYCSLPRTILTNKL